MGRFDAADGPRETTQRAPSKKVEEMLKPQSSRFFRDRYKERKQKK
jgi:hypothetical protein